MPIYEYECEKCGHQLEALQKISDKPLRECPECGRHTLARLVSAPLFRLAGSGWYETDFKSDKEQKRNLLDKGDAEPPKSEDSKATPKPPKAATPEAAAKPAAAPKRAVGARPAKAARRSAKPARKAPAKRKR
jgi:putative FmdB family regulatory protein